MHSTPEIVHQSAFQIVGVSTVTSLSDESDPVGQAARRFHAGKHEIPQGMVSHTVPAGDYVRVTHTGPESELWRTYDFVALA